jgi:hypothetical protein
MKTNKKKDSWKSNDNKRDYKSAVPKHEESMDTNFEQKARNTSENSYVGGKRSKKSYERDDNHGGVLYQISEAAISFVEKAIPIPVVGKALGTGLRAVRDFISGIFSWF